MVNTFVNPVLNPDARLGVSLFDETDPVRLWQQHSEADVEVVMRAVYRQILGNAHVMESERLTVLESKLKHRELSVREFVRQLAKSELYRSRCFDNCYRYRAIELNFKHLLGRAPNSFDEMRQHSTILDQHGFEADIDSYLNSEEYQQVFGEEIVPYYRGHKTQAGQTLLAFTNTLKLLQSASSSDKSSMSGGQSWLSRSLIQNRANRTDRVRDASDILAEVFKPAAQPVAGAASRSASEEALRRQYQEQEVRIATLQRQLVELRPLASIGAAITQQGRFASAAAVETRFSSEAAVSIFASELEQQIAKQQLQITGLQQQIMEARSLAAVGEARLNKWRQRTYF